MAASKSLSRVMDREVFGQCEVHLPQLYVPNREVAIYDHDEPLSEMAGRVAMGQVVVAEPFEHIIAEAKTVNAFPGKLIEERRSAHGVTFGRIISHPTQSSDLRFANRSAHNVALKPFNSAESAAREMRGYETLMKLGVPTFEPIGIFPAENGDHLINVTLTSEKLISLDRNEWIVGRMPNDEKSTAQAERNTRQVQNIAETLAYIHSNGVFHPDGQIKNWVTNASDNVGVIDTEKQIVKEYGHDDVATLAWEDVEILVKSLVINNGGDDDGKIFGVGMLANLPLTTVRSSLEELIINPYLEKLEEISSTADSEQSKQVELLYDALSTRFYSDETWPEHYIAANHS